MSAVMLELTQDWRGRWRCEAAHRDQGASVIRYDDAPLGAVRAALAELGVTA